MQITCIYAIYMHYFCINIQFTAYNASSVYQVYYAQDFDSEDLTVSDVFAGRYQNPELVADSNGGKALQENASSASGWRGAYTYENNSHLLNIDYTDISKYFVEFDLALDNLYYSASSNPTKFYIYNRAVNLSTELRGNPPVMTNYVWKFDENAGWMKDDGTYQHYRLEITYSATAGATQVTVYVDDEKVSENSTDVGGGDVQGFLLDPCRGAKQTIDNIVGYGHN